MIALIYLKAVRGEILDFFFFGCSVNNGWKEW